MRRPSPALVLATLMLIGGALRAADRPPRNLHLVQGHWTAWEPPTAFPEGAKLHTVERGDTLWDLAAKYYGNPYLWPQLWEKNRYIADAHWIYPGDPLVVSIEVQPVESLSQAGQPGEGAGEGAGPGGGAAANPIMTAGEAAGAPAPLGSESDIYCSGYVGSLDESFPYSIIGSEYGALTPTLGSSGTYVGGPKGIYGSAGTVKYGLVVGDIVYLDGGRGAGMTPGDQFSIVQPEQKVLHPITGKVVGRLYHYQGRVRVLSVQDKSAIAEIVESCDPTVVGAALQPFEPEPVPLGRDTPLRPVNLPVSAEKLADDPVILLGKDNIFSLGEDHVVYIDRGADDQIVPGDLFTIYRMNQPGLPPVIIGELAVLSVHPTTAVAKITKSRYTIYAGDRLDPK